MAKRKISKFARFSSMGIQMAGTIAVFTWLGTYLDKIYHTKTPWWTICLSLFGVTAALILAIRDVIKISNEKDD